MPRILKRPMFNRGGSSNQGIMEGLVDRTGYGKGDIVERARELTPEMAELLGEFTPKTRIPLGSIGADLMSGKGFRDTAIDNYRTYTTADDKRNAGVQGTAVKLGLSQAMSEAKDATSGKMSTVARQAREAISDPTILNPSTQKPFKDYGEAFTFFSTSQGDISRASMGQNIQNRARIFYPGDDQGEVKATFDVAIRPNLENKVGKELVAGNLPKGEMARKRKLRQTQEGAYFFDLGRNPPQVVRFDGVDENGNPKLATLDQETFAPISTTIEPGTNLESNLSEPPYDDSLDNPMA